MDGKILVVDDKDEITDILANYLGIVGYEALTASNGQEALEVIGRNDSNILVVITDMVMPVMDGAELIQSLEDNYPDIKVIAMSGNVGKYDDFLKEKNIPFLQKPFPNLSEILKLIENSTPAL